MARKRKPPLPPPLTPHQALRAYRDALGDGTVERTDYVTTRMRDRKVDDLDLRAVAKNGRAWPAELHLTGQYRYRLEGVDGNGRTVAVVFEVSGPKEITLITVMRPRRAPK